MKRSMSVCAPRDCSSTRRGLGFSVSSGQGCSRSHIRGTSSQFRSVLQPMDWLVGSQRNYYPIFLSYDKSLCDALKLS